MRWLKKIAKIKTSLKGNIQRMLPKKKTFEKAFQIAFDKTFQSMQYN